jgi:hypothetical protein
VAFLTQGVVDYIIWKKPFTEFMAYVEYNLNNATIYGADVWHMYFDLVLGLLIPPLSLAIFAGWLYSWKKIPVLFWPSLIYFAFHTWFPNKQERFILSILPLIMLSGIAGISIYYKKHGFNYPRVIKWSAVFVLGVNSILLAVFTVSYSKRNRVEAMTYLYKKGDKSGFFIEDSNKENDFLLPPLFYYGKWMSTPGITRNHPVDSICPYYYSLPRSRRPHYMIFWQGERIGERVANARRCFPAMDLEAIIEPSLIDKTLHWLNPLNDNQTTFIYRLEKE